MGTRTLGSVWSIFRHKYSRRSLLGFLLQKHSEMICEKSGLAFPWFFHSAHKEPFNITFKDIFRTITTRFAKRDVSVGCDGNKCGIVYLKELKSQENAAFRDNIKVFADNDQKRNISRKTTGKCWESKDKEQKYGIDLAPRFSCDSLVVVFPPRPWVPDGWSRHWWWRREWCHKTGDGPASSLVRLYNNNDAVVPRLCLMYQSLMDSVITRRIQPLRIVKWNVTLKRKNLWIVR